MEHREAKAASDVITSGWITTGAITAEFERRFADYVGVKHAIAVNSATAAMHLALEAIGLCRGDEVITSTFTFAATAEVIRYFDAKPVLVDINPQTLNLDPERIEAAITKRTRAIIPVHVAGQAVDLQAIQQIARKHNLYIIEDAAHALPTLYRGEMIGSISDLTAFSFYATKTLATGEGGMITTNNETWADRCRVMRLHGISKDAWKRHHKEGNWHYEIVAPGFKYNLTDIASAIGLVQLEKLEAMHARRQAIAERYQQVFAHHPAFDLTTLLDGSTHSHHLYILKLCPEQLAINRDQFMQKLKDHNIGASVHWIPLHLHPYYRETYGYQPQDFPYASAEGQRVLSLPIYSKMSDRDVEDVIAATLSIAEQYKR